MFETATEYAAHLSTVIDDQEVVTLAVRRKFPSYKGYSRAKPVKLTEKQASRTSNMSKFDGFYCSELTDASFKRNMEEGSKKLLQCLWREHHRILMRLSQNENCKVMPPCG